MIDEFRDAIERMKTLAEGHIYACCGGDRDCDVCAPVADLVDEANFVLGLIESGVL